MEKDYNEILLQAIDTVITQRESELKFDKTIICTITDDSERASGLYKVTDGSVVFEAYSDNSYYSKNNQVYVNIPSGDLTQKKQITGRYTTDLVNDPIIYVRPLEKVANLAQITDLNKNLSASIEANGPKNEIKIGEFTGSYDTAIYDTLAIQADFQCLLDAYSMRGGRYGLRVHFAQVENGKEISGGDLFLDSMTDMFGNPYAYIAPMMQQQAHKFSSPIGIINTISIYLYQNGDFKYKEEGKEELTPLEPNGVPNIWVSNINIFLGTDVSQVADKTVKIYTNDNMNYSPDNLSRSIGLIWYNKTQDNKLLGFDDGEFHKDYAMGNSKIPEGDSNIYYWIEWYADDSSGAAKLISEGERISQEISCIPQITMTEVYVIVWRNGQKYKSNYLTFTNQTDKSHLVFGEDITLSIINDKNAQDAYPIYGEDNLAMPGEANKIRTIRVKPIWRLGSLENYDWTGTTIEWKVPEGASMIVAQPQIKTVNETITFEKAATFSYRLSEVYHELYFNNIITCTITVPSGFTVSATKNIAFSSQGTSGTDYTLVVKPTDNRIYGFSEGQAQLSEFEAKLLDLQGNEIAIGSCEQWPVDNVEFKSDAYNVIKGTAEALWAGRSVTLETLYPVIYSKDNNYRASVPTKIIYDSFGSLTKTMKNGAPLELFADNIKIYPDWEIIYSFKKPEIEENESNKNDWDIYRRKLSQMPQINNQGVYTLIAPSMYTGIKEYAYLKATYNNEIVWTSPLIIQQYKYGSDVLNNWDGETIIDNENNRILTNAFASGYMNENNAFNGVILGEIGNIDGQTQNRKTGLYGYKNGAQTYGFRDDGTAFIGNSGAGRIQFNGTEGIIASKDWIDNKGIILSKLPMGKTGSKWDLSNGALFLQGDQGYFDFNGSFLDIEVQNFQITSGNIKMNGNPSSGEDFLSIGDDNNYIKYTNPGTLSIKTNNLIIDTQQFKLSAEGNATFSGQINVNNQFTVSPNGSVAIGKEFYYNADTKELTLPKVTVDTISANQITSGNIGNNANITIGGIKINSNSVYSNPSLLQQVYEQKHSVTGNAYQITINNWGVSTAWNNICYRIVSGGKITIKSIGNIQIECYVIDTVPTGNNQSFTPRLRAINTSEVNFDLTNYTNSYLLINYNNTNTSFSISYPTGFSLHSNGNFQASNAIISGDITCNNLIATTSGQIAGFTINGTTLTSPNLILSPAGQANDGIVFKAGSALFQTYTQSISAVGFSGEIPTTDGYQLNAVTIIPGRVITYKDIRPSGMQFTHTYDSNTKTTACSFSGHVPLANTKYICSTVVTVQNDNITYAIEIKNTNDIYISGFQKSLQAMLRSLGQS